ncbi:MAG TPA: orange carotenoid protein N-terminal domain-containing protein [Nostocaceae cyanobacterium]|nr:orange carotenoid protein N-terminal domain-containing protein [Nostocaceae cyanobacterium]
MVSTNSNNLEQAVVDFQELDIDDRLLLLGLIYQQFVDSIPLDDLRAIAQPNVDILVQEIQQLTLEEQLTFLSDTLSKEEISQEETLLGVASELNNSNFYPNREYRLLNSESKLACWYLIAQNLAAIISDIPNEYFPTPPAIELFNFLRSLNINRLVFFLKQIL